MSKSTDSGSELTVEALERFFKQADNAARPHKMRLIAPNMRIAKQWSKEYPDCEILISSKNVPTTLSKKGEKA